MSTPLTTNNEIAQLETRNLDESTAAIMVALNIPDRSTADGFVKEVLHKILLQRMVSPPDTALLCITMVGSLTSQGFAELWHKHLADEPAMTVFLERMQAADVIHGTQQGQVLDQVSLLDVPGFSEAPTSPSGGGGWLAKLRSFFR